MTKLVTLLLPLATTGPDPADVKPGWLGFLMFIALAVATFLLWLSFRRQLKKIDFEEKPDSTSGDESESESPTPSER